MNKKRASLFAPWYIFMNKVEVMFEDDPDITITIQDDHEPYEIRLLVDGRDKADALFTLLPAERVFGKVKVNVVVVPANPESDRQLDLFQKALSGNPAFVFTKRAVDGPFEMDYVVFSKRVVQYQADDTSDLWGLESTLYEDIARDIFEDIDVCFCTNIE